MKDIFVRHKIEEITAALSNLSTNELHYIEQVIQNLYRDRDEHIIYDDDYGIWTEQDRVSVAAEVFKLLNKEEDLESEEPD